MRGGGEQTQSRRQLSSTFRNITFHDGKMRLINTQSLELKEFDGNIPDYAILSHTWGSSEVNLQEFQRPEPETASKAGFGKILKCCEKARELRFEWAWVDTCCIDKTNSAELAESINSMFAWYHRASVCFAFLSDVDPAQNQRPEYETFRASRWFKRGWTVGLLKSLVGCR
jgi:hypothetical protein